MALEFPADPLSRRSSVLSVSQLNRLVAELIESRCPPVWVAGEISNFTRAASGHWYFTLKDAGAQVRCVMFRGRAQAVGFVPREGDRLEARALPGLYQPRGDFQLSVELMRRAGAGDLYQQFLRIKEKLLAEGLLDPGRKRQPPALPACIGVVTSPQAAALRDVLSILKSRAPQIPVIIYPTPVQGAEAPGSLVAALGRAAARRECDVLLLVRGGGSIEDLWAFNDEAVARAIAESPMPVICGVGHETDFTIADFVADLRAPTPTAAATLAVPARQALLEQVAALAARLSRRREQCQQTLEQRFDHAARRLRSPASYWAARASVLQSLALRLQRAGAVGVQRAGDRLGFAGRRLRGPDLQAARSRMENLGQRLGRASQGAQALALQRLGSAAQQLELVSPQAVLGRGYAILQREGGEIVRSPRQVSAGEALQAMLADGRIRVRVNDE